VADSVTRVTWTLRHPGSYGYSTYTQHRHFDDPGDARRFFARLVRDPEIDSATRKEIP